MSSSDNELPPLLGDGPSSSRHRPSVSSKRSRDSDNSSDSAFFSSDDLADASIEKYKNPSASRKQQYKRAWFEPEDPKRLHTYKQMRQATRRPKDSGIYMSSDSSNSSADDGFGVAELKPRLPAKLAKTKMDTFIKPRTPAPPSTDSQVQQEIETCLDDGIETLDLAGRGLTSLPQAVFLPLQQLVRRPRFDSRAYSDESSRTLTPELQIYLSNNRLTRVPSSLFDLPCLKVLSLRHNHISELPAALVRSLGLIEVNITMNRLRWLPWDLLGALQTGRIPAFRARPNPFVRPATLGGERDVDMDREESLESAAASDEPRQPIRRIGSTAISFYEHDGTPHKSSPVPPWRSDADVYELSTRPKQELSMQVPARPPSLFEAALRACAQSSYLPEMAGWLGENAPVAVQRGLEQAQTAIYQGESECSVCRGRYVLARAEWVEFWQDGQAKPWDRGDSILPFFRQCCSWGCAMEADV